MRLTLSPNQESLLQTVRDALSPGQACYLVGGAVRDYLLGRPLHDLDFALPEDPTRLAKRVANRLNVGYFVLDDQRHTARVVYKTPEGHPFPLDFVQFTGNSLEEDLGNRDFTLNAMALSVEDLNTVIDPLQGQADLEQGLLRPCSLHALVDDPVRILRAVRLAKQFSLAYAPGLSELAQAAALNLPNTSAERQRDELFRILEGPEPAEGIADAERFGAFWEMIPALDGPDEEKNTLDQTLPVMTAFKSMLKVLDPVGEKALSSELSPLGILAGEIGLYKKQVQAYFSDEITRGRPTSSLAMFGLLLVGKRGSEGAQAREIARSYQLSNAEAEWVEILVSEYQAVEDLAKKATVPSRKEIYRFFSKTDKTGVAIALLHLGKVLAAPGRLTDSDWRRQITIVQILLESWWFKRAEVIAPRPFLNGNKIQKEFNLTPGALIGDLLTALKEAQASGEVESEEEARKFIATKLN